MTPRRLDQIRGAAAETFELAATIYMQQRIADERAEAVRTSILAEVRRHNSFWRNLPGNIGLGLISSFLFALTIIAASMIVARDPSPIALYKQLRGQSGSAPNSQAPVAGTTAAPP